MAKSRHRDVEGRCPECHEPWPCEESQGKLGALQAWSNDVVLREALERSNQQLEINRRVNRLAAMLGFDLDVPDFCTGIMVEPQLLLAMLERISDEEVVT